ncbi:MAG: hypothetical protein ACR2OD_02360, partial [Gaiellaceae bacterium]
SVYSFLASGTCPKKVTEVKVRGQGAFTVTTAPAGLTEQEDGDPNTRTFVGCVAANTPISFEVRDASAPGPGWLHTGGSVEVVYMFEDWKAYKETVVDGDFSAPLLAAARVNPAIAQLSATAVLLEAQ